LVPSELRGDYGDWPASVLLFVHLALR